MFMPVCLRVRCNGTRTPEFAFNFSLLLCSPSRMIRQHLVTPSHHVDVNVDLPDLCMTTPDNKKFFVKKRPIHTEDMSNGQDRS